MAAPAVRRADFLMALAYATDLATGQSRDFALRSCVLAMRLADVAGLDDGGEAVHEGAPRQRREPASRMSSGSRLRGLTSSA
jgi:hypothetical protein